MQTLVEKPLEKPILDTRNSTRRALVGSVDGSKARTPTGGGRPMMSTNHKIWGERLPEGKREGGNG